MSSQPRSAHGLNRRTFLAGTAAGGLALGLGGRVQAAEPNKGGTLRFGSTQGAISDSLDPATYNNDFMFALGYAVFSTLVELGPDSTVQPNLAESFGSSPDSKVWTFRLNDEARFSDGRPVTARDVVATLSYHMGDDSTSSVKPILAQIEQLQADGDNVVVISLVSGNTDFPYVLNNYHLGIRPARPDGSIDPLSVTGSGGYTIETFEPGVRAVLKRRNDYWRRGYAHFDTVELIAIADPAARINALITDTVDLIDRPDLNTIHLLARNDRVKVHTQNGTMHYVLPMLSDVAPFNDNNVRMALKYAIDREEMVAKVLKGYGTVGNDQPIAAAMPVFNADLPQRMYDPDKARFHLAQAGLTALDVDLHVADAAFAGAVDAAVLFSASAKAAGITINVVREPNDGYFSNVWLKKPFCASYWGGRPSADTMFTIAYGPGAPWNESRFRNERFAELLVKARSESNNELRTEMYRQMQQIVSDEGATIIPAFGQYVSVMNKRVQMPEAVTEVWDLDGQRFIERWWMA